MRPAPVGVPGELYTGGIAVAVGYRNQPALTAERFVPDPFAAGPAGGRLYRTGDIARWLPDGVIEVLGRKDHQVKIRGVRLELEEVEALLRTHPDVYDAVVSVHAAPPAPPPTTTGDWEALLATADPGTVKRLLAEIE
jgi:acyl-coenzyme A synthetase/AMP-(fatty) acid ligase